MPTLSYNRSGGLPIVDALIHYSDFGGIPHPSGGRPTMPVRAMIDTGATNVIIDDRFVAALGLRYHSTFTNQQIGGVTTSHPAYLCDITFGTSPTDYCVTAIPALTSTLTNFDVIVGWDALFRFNWMFHINGDFSQSW